MGFVFPQKYMCALHIYLQLCIYYISTFRTGDEESTFALTVSFLDACAVYTFLFDSTITQNCFCLARKHLRHLNWSLQYNYAILPFMHGRRRDTDKSILICVYQGKNQLSLWLTPLMHWALSDRMHRFDHDSWFIKQMWFVGFHNNLVSPRLALSMTPLMDSKIIAVMETN